MIRYSFALVLFFPQACWASGDVGVLIWTGALLAYYIVVGIALAVISRKMKDSGWLLLGYIALSLVSWWIYMGTTMKWMALQLAEMILVPLIFIVIIMSRGRKKVSGTTSGP